MNKLLYEVIVGTTTNYISDYATAERFRKNGASVKTIFRPIKDVVVDEKRRCRILAKYGFAAAEPEEFYYDDAELNYGEE